MRELRAVPAGAPLELLTQLRAALSAEGPALLPAAEGAVRLEPGVEVPRSVAVVIETSGSTDQPKRVMLSANAMLAGAAASSGALGGDGQWLLALPAHYIAGVQVLVRSIAANTTPVVLPPGSFDPLAFIEHAEALTEPLRFTSLVPAQLARLLDAAADDARVRRSLRRFTAVLVGGQAARADLIARAEELDVRVVRTYGSSETAGGCVYDGVPIGNTRVEVDPAGELRIAGAVLAAGYLGAPGLTDQRFVEEHGERWYRTGDLGEVDPASGRVRVLGRADNVIISGGEKVSLDALERVVRGMPGLAEAVVVAAEDATWGQVPAVVIPDSVGAAAADDALLAELRAAASVLGRAARPARVLRVSSIPLLPSGKPDRRALAALVSAAA